jgi:ATP-dependent Clp protease ATP-binding subunit ClpC
MRTLLTPHAELVLKLAVEEAHRLRHNFLGTEHLLLGIIRLDQGIAVTALQKQDVDLEKLRLKIEAWVGLGELNADKGQTPYTPRTKRVMALAGKQAKAMGHTRVGTESILLGLLEEGEGVAAGTLKSFGVELSSTRILILKELKQEHLIRAEDRAKTRKRPWWLAWCWWN